MSLVHDQINRRLLEDSWDLYKVYKDQEAVEILADNVRTFEGGRQYREAAISAFIARQIASAGNSGIRETSHFSHPTTNQWYDRLKKLWPDFFAARTLESQTRASSVDDDLSVAGNAEDSRSTISSPTEASTDQTTLADDSDVPWELESNPSAEGVGVDMAFVTYDDLDLDDIDESAIALELNTSSDWYEPPSITATPNCGRRRVAHDFFAGPASTHKLTRIAEIETEITIQSGIVITEGDDAYL